MIISFIYHVTLSKFVDSSFPQCNVPTMWMFSLHTSGWLSQTVRIHRNAINFLYNPGHMTLWCLEVVQVIYARVHFTNKSCGMPLIYTHAWDKCIMLLLKSVGIMPHSHKETKPKVIDSSLVAILYLNLRTGLERFQVEKTTCNPSEINFFSFISCCTKTCLSWFV